MNIGDKVRLIHAKEEGIIVNFIGDKQVEVEIEDGFRIPALRKELVVIASAENKEFKDDESKGDLEKAKQGIYLAFVPFNDDIINLNIINETSYRILFTIGEEDKNGYKGVFSGSIEKDSFMRIADVKLSNFDQWPDYLVQIISFKHGFSPFKEPVLKKIKFKTAAFFKSKKLAPLINKEAFVFQIDKDFIKINPQELAEGMIENNSSASKIEIKRPSREIDLHIEKLTESYEGMSNSAMLSMQLNVFQTSLDNAIASGMDEIIFIHGVGNGVLKKEIQKVLSKIKTIKFFQDAQKEKFGYGATLVRIK